MTEENPGPAVVIVAAYPSVRAGLHALLRADGSPVLVLEEAESGAELAQLLADIRPDVVLLDTTGEEGSAVARTLSGLASAKRSSEVGLLVLGDCPEGDLPHLASADGLPGFGYLLRSEADGAQIITAIRAVADGLITIDRSLATYLIHKSVSNYPTIQPPNSLPGETLTPREVEVLQQMAEGLPNKQIGTKLGISLHTVKFHVAQILGKLNATSRTEAVTVGARRG
ncbi:MAG: response regulator transcription factor, partial [Fibrella sp.]|nr:response regulator transcription factor [Armatimonadota bacterium]